RLDAAVAVSVVVDVASPAVRVAGELDSLYFLLFDAAVLVKVDLLSLRDALPIYRVRGRAAGRPAPERALNRNASSAGVAVAPGQRRKSPRVLSSQPGALGGAVLVRTVAGGISPRADGQRGVNEPVVGHHAGAGLA